MAGRAAAREKAAGLGVLIASHDRDLVEAVADRVVDVGAHREPASEHGVSVEVRELRRRDPALAPRPCRPPGSWTRSATPTSRSSRP